MNTPTYQERADFMSAEARAQFTAQLKGLFAEFKNCVQTGQLAAVNGVNVAREMGEVIQGITGHQKLLSSEFEKLSLVLPDATLSFAKECLSVRAAFPERVESFADAKPVWDNLLVQMELLPKGRRELSASPPPKFEPVEDFLCGIASIASRYAKLEKTMPVEKWQPFYRQTFQNEFARLAAINERILRLA